MALTHKDTGKTRSSYRAFNKHVDSDEFDEYAKVRPERNLLAAVMCMVIHDLQLPHGNDKRSATAWVYSDSKQPFSLNWVCKYLDLDPESIRHTLKTGSYKSVPYTTDRDYSVLKTPRLREQAVSRHNC